MIKGYSTWRGRIAALFLLLACPARAQDFDYYLLALSWSPSWCATAAAESGAAQCAADRDLGLILHGLWPQFEEGWPEFCETPARDPSRRQTAAMADIMGSGGLAWRQWRKHGRCTGLEAADYFALSRRAYGRVAHPDFAARMTPDAIEAALVAANPDLGSGAIALICAGGALREIRVCLTPDLAPRICAPDVLRTACRARGAIDLPAPP